MTQKLAFRKLDGTAIGNVSQYVKNWITEYPYGEIIIGCDSQEHSRYVKYAIVIVMHVFFESKYDNPDRVGNGAHVIKAIIFDKNYKTPKGAMKIKEGRRDFNTSTIHGRLWKEVELTIEAAQMLEGCQKKIMIHIDYNSDESAASHTLYASGIGYANGMGYEAKGKPFSYVATHTADRLCR